MKLTRSIDFLMMYRSTMQVVIWKQQTFRVNEVTILVNLTKPPQECLVVYPLYGRQVRKASYTVRRFTARTVVWRKRTLPFPQAWMYTGINLTAWAINWSVPCSRYDSWDRALCRKQDSSIVSRIPYIWNYLRSS